MDPDHADPDYAGHLHHVELCTADLAASVDFWGWFLDEFGYERKNEWNSGRSWSNGPTYIVVKEAGNSDHPFDRLASGLNHLEFHAESREQVNKLTTDIRERADSRVLYEDQHPYAGDYYALYCEVPEGIKIEIVGPNE